jgi:hypothetical protein
MPKQPPVVEELQPVENVPLPIVETRPTVEA